MRYKITLIILLVITQFIYSQTTVILTPSDDTELDQGGGSVPHGTQTYLRIRPYSASWTSRTAIRFDLSAYAGCSIISANLILTQRGTQGNSRLIDLHRITSNWTEVSSYWTSPWINPGGDYSPTVKNFLNPSWTGVLHKDSVDLTSSVQEFTNGTYPNYGWLLKDRTEDASQQYWEYFSKESIDSSQRPILRLTHAGCSPLPVELIEFDAAVEDKRVKVSWTTNTEINNNYFLLLRSKDGQDFEKIGTINGSGNSTEINNYHFFDEDPYPEISYYQLKQVDFDNSYSYSAVKSVYLKPFHIINIHPNPAKEYLKIIVGAPEDLTVNLDVYNNLGQLVLKERKDVIKGNHSIEISINNLSSGNYYFIVTTPNGVHIEKEFIKK